MEKEKDSARKVALNTFLNENNLSYKEWVKLNELSHTTVWRWSNGTQVLRLDNATKIAKALNMNVEDFIKL